MSAPSNTTNAPQIGGSNNNGNGNVSIEDNSVRQHYNNSRQENSTRHYNNCNFATGPTTVATPASEIRKWISGMDFARKQADILAKRQNGTGMWLINDPLFVRWTEAGSKPRSGEGLVQRTDGNIGSSKADKILLCHGIREYIILPSKYNHIPEKG